MLLVGLMIILVFLFNRIFNPPPCYGCYSGITEQFRNELVQSGYLKEEELPKKMDMFDGDEFEEYSKQIHRLYERYTGKKSPFTSYL